MVALPPPPPDSTVATLQVVFSNGSTYDVDTTANGNTYYFTAVSDTTDYSDEDAVFIFAEPEDWFHCWWSGEYAEWQPHDIRASARELMKKKGRLRYPVGVD